jgi:hypothetical protein
MRFEMDDVTRTTELYAIEQALLERIGELQAPQVVQILDSLRGRYSTSDLKFALADLLHQGRIELTPERVLRTAAA